MFLSASKVRNIVHIICAFYNNRELIWNFVKRDLVGKYKGSYLGILWSFINPLFMLVIYTIVFSVFFKIKVRPDSGTGFYSFFLFSGMVPWIAFSQSLNHASTILPGNVNLVKKTVFPVEILPVVSTLSGFVHSLFGLFILLFGIIVFEEQSFHFTFLLLIFVMIPQLLFTVGIAWFLASTGVFIKDVREIVNLGLTAWMFMTPIFYPINIVPESFMPVMTLNPMYVVVESYRRVLLDGQFPEWWSLFFLTLLGLCSVFFGFRRFMKSKKQFAEVI